MKSLKVPMALIVSRLIMMMKGLGLGLVMILKLELVPGKVIWEQQHEERYLNHMKD